MPRSNQSTSIVCWKTEKQKRAILQEAKSQGKTMSTFLRDLAAKYLSGELIENKKEKPWQYVGNGNEELKDLM